MTMLNYLEQQYHSDFLHSKAYDHMDFLPKRQILMCTEWYVNIQNIDKVHGLLLVLENWIFTNKKKIGFFHID